MSYIVGITIGISGGSRIEAKEPGPPLSLPSALHSNSVFHPLKHSKSHSHGPKVVAKRPYSMDIDVTGYFETQ